MLRCVRILVCLMLAAGLVCPPQVRAGFGDFGIKDEAELGTKFKILMQSKFPVIKDPVIVHYIQGLLDRVKQSMPPQPFTLRINVLLDPSINAFAAPAGYVFINSGTILTMDSEAQLAAVIAHELAHVSERHIAKHIEQSQKLSIGTLVGVLAGALLGGGSALGEALAVGSLAGGQAAALKYSRDDEREADQLGLRFLTRAGYPPLAMMRSFEHIQEYMRLSGSSTPPAYMLTHPGLGERIGTIQDLAKHFPPKKPLAHEDEKTLARVKMLLRTKYTPAPEHCTLLNKDDNELSCLELLGKGVVQVRLNRMQQASATFHKAQVCRGDDPLWLRESGWFAFQNGSYDRAESLLDRALAARPKDYLARYYRARVLAETGNLDQAVADLHQVLTQVPEDAEVHRTLGRTAGRTGDHFQGYLHLAYANLYEEHEQKTVRFLDKARDLASTPAQKEEVEALDKEYTKRKEVW